MNTGSYIFFIEVLSIELNIYSKLLNYTTTNRLENFCFS